MNLTHIEIELTSGAVNVCRKNAENGIVTRSVCIGSVSMENEIDKETVAVALAKQFGWIPLLSEWAQGAEHKWIECQPQFVSVSFVGKEVPENAVAVAKSAGVEVLELLHVEEYDDNSGKTRAWFTTEEPKNWTWENPLPWGNYFDETSD